MVLLYTVKFSAKNAPSSVNKICSLMIHRINIHVCVCMCVFAIIVNTVLRQYTDCEWNKVFLRNCVDRFLFLPTTITIQVENNVYKMFGKKSPQNMKSSYT